MLILWLKRAINPALSNPAEDAFQARKWRKDTLRRKILTFNKKYTPHIPLSIWQYNMKHQ